MARFTPLDVACERHGHDHQLALRVVQLHVWRELVRDGDAPEHPAKALAPLTYPVRLVLGERPEGDETGLRYLPGLASARLFQPYRGDAAFWAQVEAIFARDGWSFEAHWRDGHVAALTLAPAAAADA